MSHDRLDSKDILLLTALKKNARASLVSLARDIDLSRSATHDRITKLEEAGVIKNYTIIIADTVLPSVRAYLTIQFEIGGGQTDVVHSICQIPGVQTANCVTGDIDMIVYCECNSMNDLAHIRDAIALFDGVTNISTRQILSTSHAP